MAVFFLDYRRYGIGDAKTWLFTAQQGGFFRTTDAGSSWTQVYDNPMTHGGNQIYCSRTGVLYSGGYQYPTRSADGGKTWTQVKTGPEDAALRPRRAAETGRRTAEPALLPWRSGVLARDRGGKLYSLPGRRVARSVATGR